MSSVLPKDYFVDLEQFPNSNVSFVWEIIGLMYSKNHYTQTNILLS